MNTAILFVWFFTKTLTVIAFNENQWPIIGILAQETNEEPNSTMISASSVKFIESSGARVVPILLNRDYAYYQKMFNSTNGVLFPGGNLTPDKQFMSTGFAKAGKIMFDLAVDANRRGDYYPIWTICLGYELLSILVAEGNYLEKCNAEDMAANVMFTDIKSANSTRMFRNAADSVIKTLSTKNVTINFHEYCLTLNGFYGSKLYKFFKPIATNIDLNHTEFISIVEAIDYPFYGIHFHPEIVLFEFLPSPDNKNVPHTDDAVYVSQYFSRFFVNETRKSLHRFQNYTEEQLSLIYNYPITYTGLWKDGNREQTYYFDL